MIVTETVLEVELRKCRPVLTQPRRSVEERSCFAVPEPGLTLLGTRPSRPASVRAPPATSFAQRVVAVPVPEVAEELITFSHCSDPLTCGVLALAAGATARVPVMTAAARPTAAPRCWVL